MLGVPLLVPWTTSPCPGSLTCLLLTVLPWACAHVQAMRGVHSEGAKVGLRRLSSSSKGISPVTALKLQTFPGSQSYALLSQPPGEEIPPLLCYPGGHFCCLLGGFLACSPFIKPSSATLFRVLSLSFGDSSSGFLPALGVTLLFLSPWTDPKL